VDVDKDKILNNTTWTWLPRKIFVGITLLLTHKLYIFVIFFFNKPNKILPTYPYIFYLPHYRFFFAGEIDFHDSISMEAFYFYF